MVVRDSGMVGSGCDIVVYVEGRKAAKSGTGQRASFYLLVGAPNIGVGLAGSGLCVSNSRLRAIFIAWRQAMSAAAVSY